MEKIRYEIDPFNRLVMSGGGRGKGLPKFRKVLDGTFKVDAKNSLVYHVKSPASVGPSVPSRVTLKGAWRLTKDHELSLALDQGRGSGSAGDLILSGSIIDAGANQVRFALTTKTADNTERTYAIAVTGSWQLDATNRLTFSVAKEDGLSDILTLEGRWEVGKHNEIVYRYEKTRGKRRTRALHTLTFQGTWKVNDLYALSYVLDARSNSAFNFRAGLGRCADDRIVFELGAGLSKRLRPAMKTVTLYGTWRITKTNALVFEIESARDRIYSITFGADARLTDKDMISFRLKSRADNRDLGCTLELSRDIMKGSGRAFLRFTKSEGETAIMGGAGFGW